MMPLYSGSHLRRRAEGRRGGARTVQLPAPDPLLSCSRLAPAAARSGPGRLLHFLRCLAGGRRLRPRSRRRPVPAPSLPAPTPPRGRPGRRLPDVGPERLGSLLRHCSSRPRSTASSRKPSGKETSLAGTDVGCRKARPWPSGFLEAKRPKTAKRAQSTLATFLVWLSGGHPHFTEKDRVLERKALASVHTAEPGLRGWPFLAPPAGNQCEGPLPNPEGHLLLVSRLQLPRPTASIGAHLEPSHLHSEASQPLACLGGSARQAMAAGSLATASSEFFPVSKMEPFSSVFYARNRPQEDKVHLSAIFYFFLSPPGLMRRKFARLNKDGKGFYSWRPSVASSREGPLCGGCVLSFDCWALGRRCCWEMVEGPRC
nr:uncharacterized protein LOC105496721 [Macaca nemestrina]